MKLRYAIRLDREGHTNNTAKYEGLHLGLRKAKALGARRFIVNTDSELIAGHTDKTYKAQKPELAEYLAAVKSMEKHFFGLSIKAFNKLHNKEAGELAKAATNLSPLPSDIFDKVIRAAPTSSSEQQVCYLNAIHSEDWRAPITTFIKGHFEPIGSKEEKRMAAIACNYCIIEGQLYRSGVYAPLLKCISIPEG